MRLVRVAVVALATLRVVETVKEAVPAIPPPWQKSLFAAAVGSGLTLLSPEDRRPETVALTGLAAAGLAAVVHDVQAALSSFADNNITEVLQRMPRRAAPLTPQDRPARTQGPLGT
jgi:hypothetical protein